MGQRVRVFVSYAHQDVEHREAVRRLWTLLATHGLDARIDLTASSEPQSWPDWIDEQLREATFVLVIASAAYRERSADRSNPAHGRGVRWEADRLRDRLYADSNAKNTILPVVLPGHSIDEVPEWLLPGSRTVYRIDELTPSGVEHLVRVLTGRPGEQSRPGEPGPLRPATAQRAQARDIAPVGGLKGRENELTRMAEFCAGDEAYLRWAAHPWAGKTALLSTFVLQPPAAVDVVSFFVTARIGSQCDSGAFTDALLIQLRAMLGQPPVPPGLSPTERDALRRDLLETAAGVADRAGRRLLLVVDGLDEDRGAVPGSGLPSIAELLPKVPPPGLKVIVAGRPDPPIPDGLPDDHPIRAEARPLRPSPHAERIERLARRELDELLCGSQNADLLALIAAAGGGLTLEDLEELTGRPRPELAELLRGTFGRTVVSRTVDGRPVLVFAHETLRAEAAERLGAAAVRRHLDRVHEWAASYRDRDWPADTPGYLLRDYAAALRGRGDHPRLLALVADHRRHDRMLDHSGADDDALREIADLQRSPAYATGTDLGGATLLAAHAWRLRHRGQKIPAILPSVLARLGHIDRAERLARTVTGYQSGPEAMERLAVELAVVDPDRAERLAGSLGDPARLARALAGIAAATPDAGRARRLTADAADALPNVAGKDERDGAAAEVATSLSTVDLRRALGIARAVTGRWFRSRALAGIAGRIAGTDLESALAIAGEITDPYWRSTARGDVARSVAARDPARARALLGRIRRPELTAPVLAVCAVSGAGDGLPRACRELLGAAEAAAYRHPDPGSRMESLVEVATILQDAEPVRAAALAAEAARLLAEATATRGDLWLARRSAALAAVAPADAVRVALGSADALAAVAYSVCATDPALAEHLAAEAARLARAADNPYEGRATVLRCLAVATASRTDGAPEEAVRLIADPGTRTKALLALVTAVEDRQRRRRLADEARRVADTVEGWQRPYAVENAAEALACAAAAYAPGETAVRLLAEARALAETITDDQVRVRALASVAAAVAPHLPRPALALTDEVASALHRYRLDAMGVARAHGDLVRARAAAAVAVAPTAPGEAEDLLAVAFDGASRIPYLVWHQIVHAQLAGILARHDPAAADAAAAAVTSTASTDAHGVRALATAAAAFLTADAARGLRLLDRAEALARSLAAGPDQQEALSWLVTALAGHTPTEATGTRVRTLLAETLAGRGFPEVLPVVAALDRSVLPAIHDDLTALVATGVSARACSRAVGDIPAAASPAAAAPAISL